MRRKLDQYFTPEWATRELLPWLDIRPTNTILEPCSGDNAIANVLNAKANCWTNDIDPTMQSHLHLDACGPELYRGGYDWIISNPPFSLAFQIVSQAYENFRVGMAMMLRLSFLEPTYDRGEWLAQHPPDQIIVLPRISFTGDGKTDSVTTAWFVWQPDWEYGPNDHILIIPKGTRENPTLRK